MTSSGQQLVMHLICYHMSTWDTDKGLHVVSRQLHLPASDLLTAAGSHNTVGGSLLCISTYAVEQTPMVATTHPCQVATGNELPRQSQCVRSNSFPALLSNLGDTTGDMVLAVSAVASFV